jgi:hypothetical protein
VGDKVSFTLLVIKTIYMYIRSQFFQFHTRQTDSCLPIRDPKTSSLQYSLSLSLSLSLFRFYKSKPTIAKPCFKHFREREREREREYMASTLRKRIALRRKIQILRAHTISKSVMLN